MGRGVDNLKSRWSGPWSLHVHLVAAALVLVLSLVLLVWSRYAVIDVGYRLSHAVQGEETERDQNRKFKVELSWQKSPGRVEKTVSDSLGLRFPVEKQFVVAEELP